MDVGGMTNREKLIKALRACAEHTNCRECPAFGCGGDVACYDSIVLEAVLGIRMGDYTSSNYAVKRRALTYEEVNRLREEGYVEISIYVEPDYEKYSTEELLELLKKRGVKFHG